MCQFNTNTNKTFLTASISITKTKPISVGGYSGGRRLEILIRSAPN